MKEPGGQERQAVALDSVEGGHGMHTVLLGEEIELEGQGRHKIDVVRPVIVEMEPPSQLIQVVAF